MAKISILVLPSDDYYGGWSVYISMLTIGPV